MIRLLFIIAILGLGSVLFWQTSTSTQTARQPDTAQQVDWFGENITIADMDENGQLTQTLFAERVVHYVPEEVTDLINPALVLFSDPKTQDEWHLSAEKGRLLHGERSRDIVRVDLWHNVVLARPATAQSVPVTLETSTLAIFPESEWAHTDQSVLIKQPGHQMQGVGMQVFFQDEQFYLLNEVNSQHESAS